MAKQEIPELSKDDRAAALDKALKARRLRAEVKEKVAQGELSFDEVLEMRDDPAIARMKVRELVSAFKSIGVMKTSQIMRMCEISENRRLGGLGRKQEARLREILKGYSA